MNRYGRGFTKDFGFAVVNGVTKPAAYIVKYDAYSLDQVKVVKVGNKPITAFAISQDGAILAFASADLSVTLLDALSFKVGCRFLLNHYESNNIGRLSLVSKTLTDSQSHALLSVLTDAY